LVIEQRPDFLAFTSPGHEGGFWLMIARKPGQHGDFLAAASQIAPATAVTLDRVVCCYPFYRPLLEHALQTAVRGFAFSYPRDRWYVRVGIWLENALRRWRGNPFRTFVHPPLEMTQMIEGAGFTLANRRRTLFWSADVFVRQGQS
jgi:hypothetical protein